MQLRTAADFEAMASAVLAEGTNISFRARGRSMSPFICNNETVVIEPLFRELRIGDVILFRSQGGQLILHRILKKTLNGYGTRGDGTSHDDGIIPHNAVLGRAVHVVNGLNFHLKFPLSMVVALALRQRKYPAVFRLLKTPGRLLIRLLQQQARGCAAPLQAD